MMRKERLRQFPAPPCPRPHTWCFPASLRPRQGYSPKQRMDKNAVLALVIENDFDIISDKTSILVKNNKEITRLRVLLQMF